METIVAVLSVQSTPTLKAALGFLDGFAKALHEGKFAEYAAGTRTTQLTVIKMESGILEAATPSAGKSKAKPKRSLRKTAAVLTVQITTTFGCEEQTQSSQTKDTLGTGTNANASSFTFEAAPKSPGLTRKQQRQVARANKILSARTEAKQFAEKEKTVTFQDVQSLVADTYSWSSLKSALDDLKLPTISPAGAPAVRVLLSHERRPTMTKMLDLEKIEEAKGAIRTTSRIRRHTSSHGRSSDP
ncbi:hypothetical protein JG687_00001063 [Phytophthora cactorum]|uniref:Uncharacterized protein n=1 Tax=Phytophthora cactorum TaxID=29920 RepID=A0A8T1UY99_9STRA|nr:hypothetical protein PC120_g1910 [Phytophthora cactorum]KAG3199152.1 hypothetical protein PC128_g5502 [Phytophthora cactorum]KAG4062789.1 hypothetical protein PC123_g2373 [Phytophthora cactorum]KAG6973159.1 hypothetical protein JG687_00001063 [Phytophthora cactorum]